MRHFGSCFQTLIRMKTQKSSILSSTKLKLRPITIHTPAEIQKSPAVYPEKLQSSQNRRFAYHFTYSALDRDIRKSSWVWVASFANPTQQSWLSQVASARAAPNQSPTKPAMPPHANSKRQETPRTAERSRPGNLR